MAKQEETKQEEKKELSKRDAFRERFAKSNPDLDMNDEDAYYEAAGRMMDDYEGYRQKSDRLRENIGRSPAFQDMVLASRDQDNFDPVIWLVETGQLDLEALQNDTEYRGKLAEARTKYLDKLAAGKKLTEEQKANMPGSVAAVTAKAAEMGLDAEQTKELMGKVYTLADNIIRGIIPVDVFELVAKGAGYDQAVEDAHAEGVAEGLNRKVDDKLRRMDVPAAPAGRQTPAPEPQPERKTKNPFLA